MIEHILLFSLWKCKLRDWIEEEIKQFSKHSSDKRLLTIIQIEWNFIIRRKWYICFQFAHSLFSHENKFHDRAIRAQKNTACTCFKHRKYWVCVFFYIIFTKFDLFRALVDLLVPLPDLWYFLFFILLVEKQKKKNVLWEFPGSCAHWTNGTCNDFEYKIIFIKRFRNNNWQQV